MGAHGGKSRGGSHPGGGLRGKKNVGAPPSCVVRNLSFSIKKRWVLLLRKTPKDILGVDKKAGFGKMRNGHRAGVYIRCAWHQKRRRRIGDVIYEGEKNQHPQER